MADLLHHRVMSGPPTARTVPLRGLLSIAAFGYGFILRARNAWYDRKGALYQPSAPVISVGNITVGGTGKTPFVIDLVKRLERMDPACHVAVVARGYRAEGDGPGDEELLLRRHCPTAAYVANPQRVDAARVAVEKMRADVIILDDGFQHRRLARVLDIVLIDATCPFGHGHLLPRGLLREPLSSLRRAELIVITRSDQVSTSELGRLNDRLGRLAPAAIRISCRHAVTGVHWLDGRPVGRGLDGAKAVLFAAIGNPASFRSTAQMLGVKIMGERWWPDHHAYRAADIDRLRADSRFGAYDLLLTTEKDAVKLASLPELADMPIGVVQVAIACNADGDAILNEAIARALTKRKRP